MHLRRFALIALMTIGLGIDAEAGTTPIYVFVVSHNERSYSDLDTEAEYLQYRESLLKVMRIIKKHGAAYHHGSDYVFLDAVKAFDVDGASHMKDTNGKNVVRYLVEDFGFTEEPHAHESLAVNYADVARKIRDLLGGAETATPTIANGADQYDLAQLQSFKDGITSAEDKSFTWKPSIIYGPGIANHPACLETHASGMWHPKGHGERYYENDATESLMVVGQGFRAGSGEINSSEGAFQNASDYIKALALRIRTGKASANKIYTAQIFFNEQKMKNSGLHSALDAELRKLAPLVKSGQVVYKQIDEIVEIWKRDYSEEGNVFNVNQMKTYRKWKRANCGP